MSTPDAQPVVEQAGVVATPAPPVADGGAARPQTTLVLRGKTAPGRNRDPLLLADVRVSGGPVFSVVLFADDLVLLPRELQVVARLPDGRGSAQLVPVSVKSDRSSDLGKMDVCSDVDDRSVVRFLPEIVRDHRGRRWLRPQRG